MPLGRAAADISEPGQRGRNAVMPATARRPRCALGCTVADLSRMSASGDLEYVPVHESGARHVAADGDAFVGVPAEDEGDSGSAAAQRRKARHRYRPAPDAAGFGCQEGVTRNIRVEST